MKRCVEILLAQRRYDTAWRKAEAPKWYQVYVAYIEHSME